MKKLSKNEIKTINGGKYYVCNEVWNDSFTKNTSPFPGTKDNPFVIIYAKLRKKKRILLTTKRLLSGITSIKQKDAFMGKNFLKYEEEIFKSIFANSVFEYYRMDEDTHSVNINL